MEVWYDGSMTLAEIIDELEFEIYMCTKSGKVDLIPGLEHAIKLIESNKG